MASLASRNVHRDHAVLGTDLLGTQGEENGLTTALRTGRPLETLLICTQLQKGGQAERDATGLHRLKSHSD